MDEDRHEETRRPDPIRIGTLVTLPDGTKARVIMPTRKGYMVRLRDNSLRWIKRGDNADEFGQH